MKNSIRFLIAAGCLTAAACDVDRTQEGELPDVDVNASGGEMPEYNVQGPDVDVPSENGQ